MQLVNIYGPGTLQEPAMRCWYTLQGFIRSMRSFNRNYEGVARSIFLLPPSHLLVCCQRDSLGPNGLLQEPCVSDQVTCLLGAHEGHIHRIPPCSYQVMLRDVVDRGMDGFELYPALREQRGIGGGHSAQLLLAELQLLVDAFAQNEASKEVLHGGGGCILLKNGYDCNLKAWLKEENSS